MIDRIPAAREDLQASIGVLYRGRRSVSAPPKVAMNFDGRLELFARGTDGAGWHASQVIPGGTVWTAWTSFGGGITGSGQPSAVSGQLRFALRLLTRAAQFSPSLIGRSMLLGQTGEEGFEPGREFVEEFGIRNESEGKAAAGVLCNCSFEFALKLLDGRWPMNATRLSP